LFLDGDERVSEELVKVIPELLKDNSVDGYWIPRKTFITPDRYLKYGLFYPDYQLRLFRVKKEYRFVGAVHEVVQIPDAKTKKIGQPLLHYPDHPKYTAFSDFKNMNMYITIHAKELRALRKSSWQYYAEGLWQGVFLFCSGFFRGKGFLDGWAGFRAHVLFAASIAAGYFGAAGIVTERRLTPSGIASSKTPRNDV
jgi:hypothetical protein